MKYRIVLTALTAALLSTSAMAQNESSGLQLNNQTDEERITFLLNVAQAYFTEKDYDAAVNAYERVLEIDPDQKEARFIIGHVYINAKQYAKAEKILTQLIKDFPEDFQLLNNLAWLYATAEDPKFRNGEKAVEYAQKAMVLAPTDHHVWSTLAEAYYVSGDYEKAYRAINHMAGIAARFGKAVTKEQVDEYNEQIRKCKRALDLQKALEEVEAGVKEPTAESESTISPTNKPPNKPAAPAAAEEYRPPFSRKPPL